LHAFKRIILALATLALALFPITSSPATDSRAADLIGAAAAQTITGWDNANSEIRPLDTQRIFYSGALPASYAGSYCAKLPAGVTCIISYKTETTNVASYVESVPSTANMIFIFHHEPENDIFAGSGANGQNFVTDFESQSSLIRASAGGAANIKVAVAAEAWQYQPGTKWDNGADCSYIPPAQYVDYYLADIYEPDPDGQDLANSPVSTQWNTWLDCVTAANSASSHPPAALGIAEYGLGTLAGDTVREQTLAADDAYLKATFTSFALWEYWWENNSTDGGCTASNCDWQFTDAPTTQEWQAIETGN
jgi:hypothetical protein